MTMPSFAERYWINQAMTLPSTTTQTSRYPKVAPAVMLLATLPGSRYATPATIAGPSSQRARPGAWRRSTASRVFGMPK